ncbi:DMT family transporter [Protaetiibacter intestinalis]|uniref:DMT family transporter n=1 Tax=Protaetiibacter intestinalis TaxID=2419774 RepID=A0A387B6M5_9MICO|nr:DMT family transporter [Protaetiibacter intestinalis]AYF97411.1 DMT family transporter [Protaetiibacter intestinalis]
MTHEHALRPLVTTAALLGAIVSGALIAVQARLNGELAVELGGAVIAACISFGIGTVICAVALLGGRNARAGLARICSAVRDRSMSPWFLFGGVAGALMVTSQGLVAPVLGVALFTVALVGGQTVGSLLIDRRGIGTMPAKALTAPRLLGAVLAIGAVVWAVSDRVRGDAPWWLLLLPLVAGVGVSWQQAVNGQLRQRAESVLAATLVSFLAGTIVLAVAGVVDLAVIGAWPVLPADPALYLGGAIGVVFVAAGAAIVPLTGVLLFGLATIAGQLTAAVLLDALFPVASAVLDLATVGGAALAVVAVGVAAIRRPTHLRARRATDSTGASSR